MTPLPKKKHAKARSRTRSSAISLSLPSLVRCKNCDNLKPPHKVCPSCGKLKSTAAPEKVQKATPKS